MKYYTSEFRRFSSPWAIFNCTVEIGFATDKNPDEYMDWLHGKYSWIDGWAREVTDAHTIGRIDPAEDYTLLGSWYDD